jgi:hypothetical protein
MRRGPDESAAKIGKNLNIKLSDGAMERLHRIQVRLAEIRGWNHCSQQQAVQYLIDESGLGESGDEPPEDIDAYPLDVPLPPPRRKRGEAANG